MSGKLFLKNCLPVILLNLLGALALSLFLLAVGNDIQTILFILAAWVLVLALYLAAGYASRKKRLEKLLEMATQLKERYLLPEVMPVPDQAEEQVYYQLLKLAGKSMLERIGEVERERGEYRTYIEQWVHEVKTPITALKLLCENNRSPFSREVLAELENINRCAEQALYYGRSSPGGVDHPGHCTAGSPVALLFSKGVRHAVRDDGGRLHPPAPALRRRAGDPHDGPEDHRHCAGGRL